MTPETAIAALQLEIRGRTMVMRAIATLKEQAENDRICGSWLATTNNLSAVIRRMGEGAYRCLVFDNALCYKRLVQDMVIAVDHHTLVFGSCEEMDGYNLVSYNPREDALLLGCYGHFIPEDAVRQRSEEFVDGIALHEERCDEE